MAHSPSLSPWQTPWHLSNASLSLQFEALLHAAISLVEWCSRRMGGAEMIGWHLIGRLTAAMHHGRTGLHIVDVAQICHFQTGPTSSSHPSSRTVGLSECDCPHLCDITIAGVMGGLGREAGSKRHCTIRCRRNRIYVGIQQMEYGALASPHLQSMGPFSATGGPFSVAAGRMSYTYGFKGPAVRPPGL